MKPQEFTIPQQYMVGEIKIDTKAQLDRTYLRLLLDAFVPLQEEMLAFLDKLLVKHDPQLVQSQLDAVKKQYRKRAKEIEQSLPLLEQTEASEREKIIGRSLDIMSEQMALRQTEGKLYEQLGLEKRSQTIVEHKREHIVKLLQSRQAMIEEGTWEKIGGKDPIPHVFSILGDEAFCFGFSNISLQASPINDIFDWMTQYHPELLPPGDPYPPPPVAKQATVSAKKERPPKPPTEFLNVPDEVTASIRTFLAIRRPSYSLRFLHDRSQDGKRAWLALLTRKLHDETIEQVTDVIIELEPHQYMTIQNVQEPPATQ